MIGIIKSKQYLYENLILVFAKIIPVNNIATGKNEEPMYMKFSNIIGFIP